MEQSEAMISQLRDLLRKLCAEKVLSESANTLGLELLTMLDRETGQNTGAATTKAFSLLQEPLEAGEYVFCSPMPDFGNEALRKKIEDRLREIQYATEDGKNTSQLEEDVLLPTIVCLDMLEVCQDE